nr:GGDEF domain-containing protein [Aliihoeflea sp. 40Bstr573]
MTGAGALSIALDQTRLAQSHKADAITDPLTGLLNRRGLEQTTAGQTFGPFAAVAIFDLDHFKRVNDTHGHSAGDAVLCDFARILDQAKRGRDVAARLGGEEFVLVMPRVTDDQAAATVRRVCAMLAAENFTAKGCSFRCTSSAGIVFGDDTRPGVETLIERADEALYAAKNSGRNRVEIVRLAS